ncbi:hypothetical protein EYM_06505 [Ignicoccus islandicus DSM 13165]|uniref:DUF1152 domain-containing protein n=1 Tax=Ignicoccus islandicus DSM 13165 TaxID=940295 RepID=A0A0U3G0V2_9CREN|nr:DUF1152 domain-containing protein [Ignicoccus islandicus]ALU11948.1 hypothetical protein EYM_06505 [Ignicoccus islandicus DSM 13165]
MRGRVLVAGIGGGGDVGSAHCVATYLRELGYRVFLASVVWERMVRDPVPGPISPKEVQGAEQYNWIAVVRGGEFSLREGKKVEPEAALLAKATGESVILLDLTGGYYSLYQSFLEAIELTGSDIVIGVDAGGDVLAMPGDDDVWSPLTDSIALAVLQDLETSQLAVVGPGCDGEMPTEKVLRRISMVWKNGGNLGGFVISRNLKEVCERAMKFMKTEASRVVLRAASGEFGEVEIRRGSRKLLLSPVLATTFFLDPKKVQSPLANAVRGTKSIEEASAKMLENCSVSELELEKILKKLGEPTKENLEKARETLLKMRRCSDASNLQREEMERFKD